MPPNVGGKEASGPVQDGQRECVRGTWVKVAEEYVEWDVFKKFAGKVGRLTSRHLSGMWFAEFPGGEEYSFLCGPLLFQLEYSSAHEAERARWAYDAELRRQAEQDAEKEEKSRSYAEMHQKKAAEIAENSKRLFSLLQAIQGELFETQADMQRAVKEYEDLSYKAKSLERELADTQGALRSTQGELRMSQLTAERDRKAAEDMRLEVGRL